MELLQLLVGVAKEHGLGMATMGLCYGSVPHLWVWPWIYGADSWIYGADPRIYGAGRRRSSCWWG